MRASCSPMCWSRSTGGRRTTSDESAERGSNTQRTGSGDSLSGTVMPTGCPRTCTSGACLSVRDMLRRSDP